MCIVLGRVVPGVAAVALSAFERQVLLLNLQLKMVPKEAPVLTVMQFFSAVQKIYAAGQAGMLVGDHVDEDAEESESTDENLLTIEDYRKGTDGTQTFLFHHGDARAADPRFKSRTTAAVRSAGKLPDETVSHAAHLVLGAPVATTAKPPNTIRAVLERVPGLGRASILSYLNRLVRLSFAESDFRFTAENGKRLRCHPRLESSQPASANMKEDLAAGRLSRIEFIKTEVFRGWTKRASCVPCPSVWCTKLNDALRSREICPCSSRQSRRPEIWVTTTFRLDLLVRE